MRITPSTKAGRMSHLFLDLNMVCSQLSEDNTIKNLTVIRTGKPVTLIYIAISEPETTLRAMNELLFLLTVRSLDSIFRNPSTGGLKRLFSLIVDNGHQEDPDSPLTQMCLACC